MSPYKGSLLFTNLMTNKSWIVTLAPLVLALAQTAKSIITGEPLTDQEIELIKYLFGMFASSGIIGAYVATRKK